MTTFENLEGYALSKDRTAFLDRLVKGSDDYYYYTTIDLLRRNTDGKLTREINDTLDKYAKSEFVNHTRLQNLKARAKLLSFDNGSAEEKKEVFEWLIQELGLSFAASPELTHTVAATEEEASRYPTKLDPSAVAAFNKPRPLYEYNTAAHPYLIKKRELITDTPTTLLESLLQADVDGVMELIKANFDDPDEPREFGELSVHHLLTLEQTDELLKHRPGLIDSTSFVSFYINKLAPHGDIDIKTDLAAREEYLNKVWRFVVGLAGGFNSYKVTVLYHQLSLQQSRGVYNEDRFMEYLTIPRYSSYANSLWLSQQHDQASSGETVGLLPGVHDDEPLVRDFLLHFFREKDRVEIKPFQHYVDEQYLKRLLAEAKLTSGAPDSEKWVALLGGAAAAEVLKQRVDIHFSPSNPKYIYDLKQEVKLDVDIKNVSTLIVKVFEIDTTAYYRLMKHDIPEDISLDGLVAKTEAIHNYSETPIVSVRRSFTFPELSKRGVYVIEFIGNGQSSRALVRKGQLNFVQKVDVQGHVFKILDEQHNVLTNAELWLEGHLYHADKNGEILIPFTNSESSQFILLTSDGFSNFHHFYHRGENYELSAGFHVERESLLRLERAKLLVRAALFVSGVPISVERLEDVSLELTASDQDGTPSTKKTDNFALKDAEEPTFEFLVPDNARSFAFTLSAKVRPFSAAPGSEPIHLTHSQTFTLNDIDSSPLLEDAHLSYSDKGYRIHVLGKTGEPKSGRMVPLQFTNKYLTQSINVTLQTDRDGIIELGSLEDISSITSVGVAGKLAHKTWNLRSDSNTQPLRIHALQGHPLRVAYPLATLAKEEISFLQSDRSGGVLHDRFGDLTLQDGFLLIGGAENKLPVGDYVLRFRGSETSIQIQVVSGPLITLGNSGGGRVISFNRAIEVKESAPIQVAGISVDKDEVKVRVLGGKEGAVRVHAFCTSLHPEYDAFPNLSGGQTPNPESTELESTVKPIQMLENRAISEEYRYILERRYAPKRAGNMLTQPSLLLQPRIAITPERSSWGEKQRRAMKKAEGERKMAEESMMMDDYFGSAMPCAAAPRMYCASSAMAFDLADASARYEVRSYQPNIDFLPSPAGTLLNLRPDKDGYIVLSRSNQHLTGTQLRVIATDGESTAYKTAPLPIIPDASPILHHKDLRLGKQAFDPNRHFTEQKKITLLQAGDKFGINDLATAKFEIYDTLSKVYNLLLTLSGNDNVVQKFNFLLKWEHLSLEEKLAKYDKFASHELNFFVYKRDKKFFDSVVAPFLRNKKEKTFLDHWLLEEDLSSYLLPSHFGTLNVFEKILLGTRTNRSAEIAKFLSNQFSELPKNQERFNHIFNTALAARGLDAGDGGVESTHSGVRGGGGGGGGMGGFVPQRQFFQVLGATKQYGETNYYLRQKEEQDASLVQLNGFWSDYAQHVNDGGEKAFVSKHVGEATLNYTEILLVLAVLDLPALQTSHSIVYRDGKMHMDAASGAIVFHKEILESAIATTTGGVLVSQHYWDPSDATFVNEEGEEVDKYITGEFLHSKEYGCQVILTNVSKSRAKVDVLLQIPVGSIPLNNGFLTAGKFVELPPNSTKVLQYYFYFPQASDTPLQHFPAQVSRNEAVVAFAPATSLTVVNRLSGVDTQSWGYVSQQAPEEDFLRYLSTQNLFNSKVNFSQIRWRLLEEKTFNKVVAVLNERLIYDGAVWAYGILHRDVETTREYLHHSSAIVARCQPLFHSALLDVAWEGGYEHLEYSPLVNERAHRKRHGGSDIDNPQFKQQYQSFLEVLTFKNSLDALDLLALTYYLVLQDRIDEALSVFKEIPHPFAEVGKGKEKEGEARSGVQSPNTTIQYDYLQAYLDFFSEKPSIARDIALKYTEYPVPAWNKRFKEILQQLEEMQGGAVKVHDKDSRSQVLSQLAASEPSFDFTIEGNFIHITYSNLSEVTVSFFAMDVEVLFSSSPFGLGQLDQFSYVRANSSMKVQLPTDSRRHSVELPKEQQTGNSMVRVSGGAIHKSLPHFAHSLSVLVMESYGQLSVKHEQTGAPISRAYVKVYAKNRSASTSFYKDGYTDLRGRFDYVSLNSNALQSVEKFSILVLSENNGAVIKEAAPPKV